MALKSDGTLWAWGANSEGSLGDGTTTQRESPVQVIDLTGVVTIAAGVSHSLAIKSDGTAWAWGSNNGGALGDGTTTDRTSPVQVSDLSEVVSMAGGSAYSLAVTANGTLWTWGTNGKGQLGNGTTNPHTTPFPIPFTIAPTAPLAFNYAEAAATSITLVWNAASDNVGVIGYNVYRGATLLGTTSDRTFVDSGLTSSTAYSYTVRALDTDANLSPASSTLNVSTTSNFSADSDSDGIPDSIETALGTNGSSAATASPAISTQQNIHRPIP